MILRSSPQRSVTALQLVMNLQAGAAVLILVSYLRITTHMAEIMMGVDLAGAVGGGAGSCLVVPRLTKLGWGSLVGGLVLLLVLGYVGLSVSSTWPDVLSAILFLDGASAGIFILAGAARQYLTAPADLSAAMGATIDATRAGRVAAAIATGIAVAACGPVVTLRVTAAILLAGGLISTVGPLFRRRVSALDRSKR